MNPSCIDSAVSNSTLIDAKLEEHRVCESTQCPSCGHKLLDHKPDWVGLPAGVKFDPTDQELIDHLEAKVKAHDLKSHPLIDEFIPTIEGEDGICYTHPEKLPGVTMDGLSKHFFHRPSKAYTTGTRKRRKIQSESKGETRWHKTGKTRPVMVNGQHKGCKKILVLYTNFGKHRKPEKTYWVMHQYHLGEAEEEKDGELVVSKIFYQTQPRQCTSASASAAAASLEEGGIMVEQYSRNSGGNGSCSSSREVVIGNRSDEKLPSVYSCIRMQQHMMKTDNFCSFAPFSHTFSEVDMGEAGKAMVTDELVADVRVPLHRRRRHHLVQEQQQQQLANFNIERPVNSISNLISSTPVLQQASIVLENPYHAPMMLLQTDHKFQQPQQPQQEKVDHRSVASLEDLIMSCSTVGIKGVSMLILGQSPSMYDHEASIPHSQAAEWQYSYWPPDNLEHDHPGQ